VAITPVAVGGTASSSSTSSLQTNAVTYTVGNALIIFVLLHSASATVSGITTTVSDTATFVARVTSGTLTVECWYIASLVGGSTRFTAAISGGPVAADEFSYQFSGVVAFGNHTTNTASAAGSLATTSLTTQDSNNFIVCGFGSDGANAWSASFTTGTFRQRTGVSGAEGSQGDNTSASPAAITCAAALSSGTANLAAIAFELRTSSGGGTTYFQSLAGGLTPGGALGPEATFHQLVGAGVIPAGSLVKTTLKNLVAAGLAPAAALVKLANKNLTAASLTPGGNLVTSFLYQQALTAALSFSGAVAGMIVAAATAVSWLARSLASTRRRAG
jgi:hypothetical protein